MTHNLDTIILSCIAEHGIDPQIVYCSTVGHSIGFLSDETIRDAIDMIDSTDLETIVDDLVIRTLIAARPSPSWNSLNLRSFDKLRKTKPLHLLTYLLNRMYAQKSRDGHLKQTFDQRLQQVTQKIHLWRYIESCNWSAHHVGQALLLLLEIDSKFNLSKQASPLALVQTCQVDSDVTEWLQHLANWCESLRTAKIKQDRLDKSAEEFWSAGSRLTRTAYAQQYLRVTPPSPTRQKKLAHSRERDALSIMLDSLMDNAHEAVAKFEIQPATTPVGYIKPGGFKFNIVKAPVI